MSVPVMPKRMESNKDHLFNVMQRQIKISEFKSTLLCYQVVGLVFMIVELFNVAEHDSVLLLGIIGRTVVFIGLTEVLKKLVDRNPQYLGTMCIVLCNIGSLLITLHAEELKRKKDIQLNMINYLPILSYQTYLMILSNLPWKVCILNFSCIWLFYLY